jgi:hypothetical protein
MDDAAFYREKAMHCRRLAKLVRDEAAVTELLEFAELFDAKAERSAAQQREAEEKTEP